jgi:hypothetical protein
MRKTSGTGNHRRAASVERRAAGYGRLTLAQIATSRAPSQPRRPKSALKGRPVVIFAVLVAVASERLWNVPCRGRGSTDSSRRGREAVLVRVAGIHGRGLNARTLRLPALPSAGCVERRTANRSASSRPLCCWLSTGTTALRTTTAGAKTTRTLSATSRPEGYSTATTDLTPPASTPTSATASTGAATLDT